MEQLLSQFANKATEMLRGEFNVIHRHPVIIPINKHLYYMFNIPNITDADLMDVYLVPAVNGIIENINKSLEGPGTLVSKTPEVVMSQSKVSKLDAFSVRVSLNYDNKEAGYLCIIDMIDVKILGA